jgi:hypothetical protein
MAMALVLQTADRKLGKTESNWVAAVESGTGTTVTSVLFERRVPVGEVEEALGDLVGEHPRLRSVIVQEGSEYFFRTAPEAHVSVCEVDRRFEEDNARELWHLITESELNAPFPTQFPLPVFAPKLYLLPQSQSLLVLRLHAAAADMASTATIVKHIVSSLHSRSEAPGDGEAVLPSVEDAIPPGQANKPFWAHGVDVVGYGLVSRRHAYLPFDDTDGVRTSNLLRGALTVNATSLLLKAGSHLNTQVVMSIHPYHFLDAVVSCTGMQEPRSIHPWRDQCCSAEGSCSVQAGGR